LSKSSKRNFAVAALTFPTLTSAIMFHPFRYVIFLFLIFLLLGCTRSNRPDGLPKLYPCVITVTQNGDPVADVSVQLISKQESIWPVTGITNTSGNAKLVTYGQFPGAPLGDYTVVFSKTTTVSLKQGNEFQSGITEVYSLINVEHTQPETSKLEMSIEKGTNQKTFELGAPVRILTDTIKPGT
jgi:hypothetical protein